jgi:hypothetical protein
MIPGRSAVGWIVCRCDPPDDDGVPRSLDCPPGPKVNPAGMLARLATFSYRNVREERMPDYRIYWLDQDYRITCADNLIVDSDEAALAASEARLGTAPAMEVWRGALRIGRVFAKKQ